LSSSPTVVDGSVYVGALDNKTYCINGETGNVNWTFQTNGYITSSPAVVNSAIYVTSQEPSSGVLYKIDADNGSLVWKQTLPYQPTFMGGKDMHASPVVAEGLVLTSSSTSIYYALNATNGNVVWTYKNPAAEEFILCSPIFTDGKVFLIDKFSIVCVNAKNGSTIWSSFLGDELYISPTYADSKLYVVTDQRHLYVLNAQNGEKIGVYGFSSNSWSSPTIYEGKVFVGNNDWNVYCLAEYPSLVGSLTLTLDKNVVATGDLVTGFGQLVPSINNATLVITLAKPDGSSTNLQVTTSPKGSYSFTFNPPNEGTWTATALWWSDKSYYKSVTSEAATLAVYGSATPTPSPTETPSPTVSVTPDPTPTPFDELKFAGVPLLYLYIGVIVALVVVVVATGYLYMKTSKN
jgi:hypothetical protein